MLNTSSDDIDKSKETPPQQKPVLNEHLTKEQVKKLCENENFRYLPNKKAGHAVFITDKDGNKVAYQFEMPDTKNTTAPEFRPLENIQEINRFGLTRYVAESPQKTKMYAKRFNKAIIGDGDKQQEVEIGYFSPSGKEGEPFWGSTDKPYPLFNPEGLKKKHKKDFNKELSEIKQRSKGGIVNTIHTESVHHRDLHKTRNPDQNKVMGESAKDAYDNFYQSWTDELSDKAKKVFKRAIDAPLREAFYSNYRPEWLHAVGWSLSHKNSNPQQKSNLGSAPKWANTEMMVLERIAKFFAINAPNDYTVKIMPLFEMLLDTELINSIHFEVTVEHKQKFVKFLQDLNPFQENPHFRKASDLAQATVITQAFLQGTNPMKKQDIHQESKKPATNNQVTFSLFNSPKPTTKEPEKKQQETQIKQHKKDRDTKLNVEKSIVRIECHTHDVDYDNPWAPPMKRTWSGSGVVVENNGRKYVLTNAHVAESAVYNTVRLANERKKFQVKPLCISYQADLALLDVTDPEFQRIAEAPELGNMVSVKDKVQIIGFPIGGQEVYFSKGITSRIESGEYSMSGQDMLHVQIDAAVNGGNSGGPVVDMNGKVVGIAFQGYDFQGGGYMIPIVIVKHFLNEAFSGKTYRGFPTLPMTASYLENDLQRKHYGLSDKETGVLITTVSPLSDLHGKILPKDILLSIDGFAVSGDAKVDIPGIGKRLDYDHITHSKYIGDSVEMMVKRKNVEKNTFENHTFKVLLDNVSREYLMVKDREHDKMPTYYINSGFAFAPLTLNYLESRGADLDVVTFDRPGHYLIDVNKKDKDAEFVVIFEVFSGKETEEYDCHINKIVTKVNGKEIKNFKELISAFESNTNDTHVVETLSGNEIVLKNMSKSETAELLKKNHIPYDRSEDLRIGMPVSQEVKPIAPVITKEKLREEVKKLVQDEPVDEIDEEFDPTQPEQGLSMNDMPGLRKYNVLLNEMEQRYQDNPDGEEEDFDFDNIGSSSDEEEKSSEEESNESSGEEIEIDSPKKPTPVVVKPVEQEKSRYNTRLFRKQNGQLQQKTVTFQETVEDEEASEEKPLKKKKM